MEGNNNSLEAPGPGPSSSGFRGFRRAPHHWAFQMGLRTAQEMATAAPRRIREDLNQVFRGLSPLSLMDGGASNSASVSWLLHDVNANRNVPLVPRQQPIPQIVTNRNDITINLDQPPRLNPENQSVPMYPVLENVNVVNNLGRNNNQENVNPIPEAADAVRNSPELQALISLAEKYVPFVLILLMKIVFDHRIGILIIAGLFLTFCHANTVVKREVGKQGKRQFSSLAIVTVNLCTCIGFVYFVLAEDNLAYALILIPPYSSGGITLWEVLWIVTVTDFVLKLINVLLKVIVTALPGKIIPFKKKGKYFLFLETTFQLYRTISPMQHWLYYFSESYHGSSKVFGVILSAAYLVTKCKDIVKKTKVFRKAFSSLLQSVNYGVQPSADQLKTAGEACPICQDDYRTPTMLQCKHIFCEECVSIWFDRERTCPMCRAQIADDPSWRDGSTTFLMQVF